LVINLFTPLLKLSPSCKILYTTAFRITTALKNECSQLIEHIISSYNNLGSIISNKLSKLLKGCGISLSLIQGIDEIKAIVFTQFFRLSLIMIEFDAATVVTCKFLKLSWIDWIVAS